jgi:hypothetical protein
MRTMRTATPRAKTNRRLMAPISRHAIATTKHRQNFAPTAITKTPFLIIDNETAKKNIFPLFLFNDDGIRQWHINDFFLLCFFGSSVYGSRDIRNHDGFLFFRPYFFYTKTAGLFGTNRTTQRLFAEHGQLSGSFFLLCLISGKSFVFIWKTRRRALFFSTALRQFGFKKKGYQKPFSFGEHRSEHSAFVFFLFFSPTAFQDGAWPGIFLYFFF